MNTPLASTSPEVRIHVLSERNMQWYLGTQLISLTGFMLRSALLSLLLIELVGLKEASSLVGWVFALNMIPGAFLGIFCGLFLDAFDKRRILQITSIFGALQAAAFAYLAYKDVHHIATWKIMTIMGFAGITNSIDGIGRNAIIKNAVVNKYNQRIAAVYFSSLYTAAMIIGNGIAGYLVLWIGYGNSFVLNGLSFLVLIFGLHKMNFDHVKLVPRDKTRGIRELIKEGRHYTFGTAGIKICIYLSTIITIFGYCYNVILSIIAKGMFNGGPKEYSYLASIAGLGSLAGSIVTVLWHAKRPRTFVVCGCLIIGSSLIAFSRTTDIHTAACLIFLCGFGFMTSFLPVRGAIMALVDDRLVGIVLGFTFSFFYGGMALSSIFAGYLARAYGSPTVLATCGTVLTLTALATPWLPGIKEMGRDDIGERLSGLFLRRLEKAIAAS